MRSWHRVAAVMLAIPAVGAPVAADAQEAALVAPPGIHRAHWHLVDFDNERAVLFTEPLIQQVGAMKRGWLTQVRVEPLQHDGKEVYFLQHLLDADCSKGSIAGVEAAMFDREGTLIETVMLDEPAIAPPEGSYGEMGLGLLCGSWTVVSGDLPLDQDAQGLVDFFQMVEVDVDGSP